MRQSLDVESYDQGGKAERTDSSLLSILLLGLADVLSDILLSKWHHYHWRGIVIVQAV